MSATTHLEVPALAAEDDPFVTDMQYAFMPLHEAARDPRTPEKYLLKAGFHSRAQFFAMAERRPMSSDLAGWLVQLASTNLDERFRHEAVVVASRMPHVTTIHVERLVNGLNRFSVGYDEAVDALLRHPLATENTVAKILCLADGAFGDGTRLEREAGQLGFLAPTALRLVRTEKPKRRQATPRQTLDSTLEVIFELDALIGGDPTARRAVAALGPAWSAGTRDLVETARGVASPAYA